MGYCQIKGQLKLKAASILVVGVGGLGCPAAAYLAAAGIGTIGLIDGDIVEVSNLQRQILHSTETLGMGKVDSALLSLRRYDSALTHEFHELVMSISDLDREG